MAERCIKCKELPYVVNVDGLYYARCKCKKWDNYQFLGVRKEYALEEWDKFNRKINRAGNKRKKDEEYDS